MKGRPRSRREVKVQATRKGSLPATPHAGRPRPADLGRGRTRRWSGLSLIPFVLVGVGLGAYHSSFTGAFVLDDLHWVIGNVKIRRLWPPWEVMAHASRPLVELSLAVNYALGGLNVWGYHAFNLAVHILAGLVLFGILRRTLDSETLRARYGRSAPWLAMAAAALWIVHPLQTESVTYIIQRAEALMGLFFLLTLYCVIRGAQSPNPRGWFTAAVLACALGMGSKEVMVSAPLVILLYDRVFIAGSFKNLCRQRWRLHAALAATWVVLAALLATGRVEEQTVLVADLTPWRYAITQFGVIAHYLRLCFWPHPLVLDYTWPTAPTLASVAPAAVLVLALLGGTVWALHRQRPPGFLGAWFFLILSPTSSIMPIADVAFEHRMYLPLAAVVALVVIGGHEFLRAVLRRLVAPDHLRRPLEVGLLVAAVAALGYTTVRRNEDYRSEYSIWSDTVAKRPMNPRAHYNLGIAVDQQGKIEEAIAHFSEALRLSPDHVDAHINLGAALFSQGRITEATTHFAEAVRLKPNYAVAHNNLGAALVRQGQMKEAALHFSEAVRLKPSYPEAHDNLGTALYAQGQIKEAIAHFSEAVRLKPDFTAALKNLRRAQASQQQVKDSP